MKISKKSQKAIGAVVGVSALGIAGYLAYKYLTREKEYVPEPAEEEFVIPEIPISLENILLIVEDVSLTQAEKIAILEAMYNEQFIFNEQTHAEIIQIESDIEYIDAEIAKVIAEMTDFNEQVSLTKTALTEAQKTEAIKYNAYIEANNILNSRENHLAELHRHFGLCGWWNVLCLAYWRVKINVAQGDVDRQRAITGNRWNEYLDAEQLRKEAENEYNSAMLALEEYKEEFLFPLQEEKIVLVNSLNSWKIAYQASQNLINELITQLEIFGITIS